jgi:hypothetical protein
MADTVGLRLEEVLLWSQPACSNRAWDTAAELIPVAGQPQSRPTPAHAASLASGRRGDGGSVARPWQCLPGAFADHVAVARSAPQLIPTSMLARAQMALLTLPGGSRIVVRRLEGGR